MSLLRKKAVTNIISRKPKDIEENNFTDSDVYGRDVFNLKTMKDFLPKPVYQSLLATIRRGENIDPKIANDVADAMKRWAIQRGASHYTHWFLPLTASTAEKHDAFIKPDIEGGVTQVFSGENLIQGESDASSFPSGGLRATFEARGYTVWDPTSPAFIKRGKNVATLCIPTAFHSYHGESLDKKTPLLRSMQAISAQIKRLLKCFKIEVDGKVHISLGAEQEYFLIDKELFYARPDLLQCGRTLFGNVPPKHQQLEDHYFGAIKPRILNFMAEVDRELWRLGIPAKTRHNEVAPGQFEIAAHFEELNLAVDHNMLIMEILRDAAERHNFVCLLHEKPFAGVNGSGKHNNWSISANGLNLLNPGHNPHENALFLTILCAIIKAFDKHADLMISSISHAGNAHRLGANEAPPAIMSIFLGEQLTEVIDQIEKGGAKSSKYKDVMRIGVDTLPDLPRDATDRNRTSPFAFTGNKFEFRAVGSSQSCAGPNTVLNTIVAESLDEIATKLEKVRREKKEFNKELQTILQDIIVKHKKIIFNGDNYSKEWIKEAEKRGLPNIKSIPVALKTTISEKAIKLFSKYRVYNKSELYSRYEVYMEEYKHLVIIEARLGLEIAKIMILPAVIECQSKLLENITKLLNIKSNAGFKSLRARLEKIGQLIDILSKKIEVMEFAIDNKEPEELVKLLQDLRVTVDLLEMEVDDSLWPLPKYSEMFFLY